jgi:multidrug efflux pump subunit AcrB
MIRWFALNPVAATLLMFGTMMAGALTLQTGRIPLEVFPDTPPRWINVNVPYPGSTPEEVEETIVLKIEEAIMQVQGIKRLRSSAGSSGASVSIEVDDDADARTVLNDVKNKVDSISTFPGDSERPQVLLDEGFYPVVSVVVSGDMSERDLRKLGEQVRGEIAALPGITHASLGGVRRYEISIEIPEATMRKFNLTLEQISRAIRDSALDLPAGVVQTESGDVALKTRGRAYSGEDYAKVVVLTREDGSKVTLGEISKIDDGFNENPLIAKLNGKRCVMVTVAREGRQNAVAIAQQVKDFVEQAKPRLPDGVDIVYWNDRSKIVKGRIDVLLSNGLQSFCLVFITLLLFLRLDVAVWVSLGIPMAFLGAFALMPWLGITINSSSLFGFIMVLGIVVDDAIVVSESVCTRLAQGQPPELAAIEGTRLVSTPVIFGVLTNCLAFVPLLIGMGDWGSFFQPIGLVVIPVMLFSLMESQLCLPAHISHPLLHKPSEWMAPLQTFANRWLDRIIHGIYAPLLGFVMRRRYASVACLFGLLALLAGFIFGGRINYLSFPRVPSERVEARLSMLDGTPIEVTEANIERIYNIAQEMRKDYTGPDGRSVFKDIMYAVGGQRITTSYSHGVSGQSHLGEVTIECVGPEERSINVSTLDIANDWRKRIGDIVGADELNFRAEIFRGGDPIDIQLTGANPKSLLSLSEKIKEKLGGYSGVFDIRDSLDEGRSELQFSLKPEARQFGITLSGLARQVREAFYGNEVQRIQRGQDEVRVFLRYPREDRRNLATLETMRIRAENGVEVPFSSVAEVTVGKSFNSIRRTDRERALNITADVEKGVTDLPRIKEELAAYLGEIAHTEPGVKWTFEGEAESEREANKATVWGGIFILFGLYVLLAVPFKSYLQPIVVLLVVPFGVVGAVIGHMLHGLPLSMISIFGMLALSGVVINDSIVMVDFINKARAAGMRVMDAVLQAGPRRFRPILLTSVTTFVGLVPLIFERTTTSQFLIPMAVSLGYGILFGTVITLFLVPLNYLMLEDVKALYRDPDHELNSEEPEPAGA